MIQYSYLLILHNTFDIIFKILCREENWDSDLIMNSGHITRKTKAVAVQILTYALLIC